MHGWKWRLADGKCLSSVGHDLRCAPAGSAVPGEPIPPVDHAPELRGQHEMEEDAAAS
jgi:UDP-MurNAc hydroxylase